jgi:hypothetical protein
LGDVERDSVLSFLLAFVQGIAVAAADAEQAPGTDAEWWEQAGPLLARPSTRSATRSRARRCRRGRGLRLHLRPAHAYAFGLERVLDGLAALVTAR